MRQGDGANVSFLVDTDAVCLRNETLAPSPCLTQELLHPDVLDVLVQLDGAVLRVAHTLVERRDAALGVQVHFGRAGLARQALGLGQQRGPEAAAARLGKHGQAAEHPATRLIGAVVCMLSA